MSKNLAVLIRFYNKKCVDRFLDLIPLTDSNAESIFNAIIKILKDHSIPPEKMPAFTADNCSVMMGQKSGVQARLKQVVPNLYINGCVCHILNLASMAACDVFPNKIYKFLKDINYYFCNSPLRRADLQSFQEYFGTEMHVILKYAPTRWLSRQGVVDRILEQWNALQYYFTLSDFENKSGNQNIKLTYVYPKFFKILFIKYIFYFFHTF